MRVATKDVTKRQQKSRSTCFMKFKARMEPDYSGAELQVTSVYDIPSYRVLVVWSDPARRVVMRTQTSAML